MSDSDPDFWDLGQDATKPAQRKRGRVKKSQGFPEFPLNVPDNVEKGNSNTLPVIIQNENGELLSPASSSRQDASFKSSDSSVKDDNDQDSKENADYPSEEDQVKDDSEGEEEEEEESDNDIDKKESDIGNGSSGESNSSNRTSCVSGSDLPQDSPKDTALTNDSTKSSKDSLSESHWVVEEYLLPPQQKLKLALYRGRKLLAAKEADSCVREFIRAQALARIVHGDQHWRYCRCKIFLAQAYLYIKEYAPQAEATAREAIETINIHFSTSLAPSKKPQVHHTLLWGYLVSGQARTRLGQLPGAQESLSHALHHTRFYSKLVSKRKKKLTPSLTMDRALDLEVKVLCAQATMYTKRRNYPKAK
ncbi:hypothetical protein SK128_025115, partial [Halocaridina rubra]